MSGNNEWFSTTFLRYEKIILSKKDSASISRCGFFLADFSRPASVCLRDSLMQGIFVF